MFADDIAVKNTPITDALSRRGVGKVAWRNVLDILISSEKEDLRDLAILRHMVSNNPQGLKLIAQMQERKSIRIVELNDLRHYREPSEKTSEKTSDKTYGEKPDWLR